MQRSRCMVGALLLVACAGHAAPEELALEEPVEAPTDRAHPEHPSPFCPTMATDHPSASVALTATDVDHRVADYHGCKDNPTIDAFRTLEDRIDEIAGTQAWIARCLTERCRRC